MLHVINDDLCKACHVCVMYGRSEHERSEGAGTVSTHESGGIEKGEEQG